MASLGRFALVSSLLSVVLLAGTPGHAAPAQPPAPNGHSSEARSGKTITFPYRQRQFLYSRNESGGLAYVTSGAPVGATLPVVVFLHGMNADERVHMWFGPPYGDLRSTIEPLVSSGKVAPFILAAPTHTRYATGATVMWPRFDIADFLGATEAALAGVAHVDRRRLIVVGHSGAGCNANGGLLGESVRTARPIAVLAVDTCVAESIMPELVTLASVTRLRFYWQATWARPITDLERACIRCRIEEVTDLGAAPHVAIVPEALRRALPELLPAL